MDEGKLRIFALQIQHQCHFVIAAYDYVQKSLEINDYHSIFFGLEAFLLATANISKFFWAQNDRGENADRRSEREALRERFGVTDPARVWRDMRNDFEHLDERIDRWWAASQDKNYVDMNYGTAPAGAIGAIRIFRHFDTQNQVITFWDDSFPMLEIVAEAERLLTIAPSVWMPQHPTPHNRVT